MRSSSPSLLTPSILILALALTSIFAVACGDEEDDPDAANNAANNSTNNASNNANNNANNANNNTSNNANNNANNNTSNNANNNANNTENNANNANNANNNAGVSEWAFVGRGALFTDDLTAAQDFHDQVAMGGEQAAKDAGDTGHKVFLGTDLLGSTPNEFLALDTWNNAENMIGFYMNPDFAAAFGMLFAGVPTGELFSVREDFVIWGDLSSGAAEPERYFVVVRGRMAATTLEDMRAAHDPLAEGGREPAMAAGDLAHVVLLGLEDQQEFMAIDIWADPTNIEAFYGDPNFQAAFGALFEAPPTVTVFHSTGWHQW